MYRLTLIPSELDQSGIFFNGEDNYLSEQFCDLVPPAQEVAQSEV
jgi:hypothetical protein